MTAATATLKAKANIRAAFTRVQLDAAQQLRADYARGAAPSQGDLVAERQPTKASSQRELTSNDDHHAALDNSKSEIGGAQCSIAEHN